MFGTGPDSNHTSGWWWHVSEGPIAVRDQIVSREPLEVRDLDRAVLSAFGYRRLGSSRTDWASTPAEPDIVDTGADADSHRSSRLPKGSEYQPEHQPIGCLSERRPGSLRHGAADPTRAGGINWRLRAARRLCRCPEGQDCLTVCLRGIHRRTSLSGVADTPRVRQHGIESIRILRVACGFPGWPWKQRDARAIGHCSQAGAKPERRVSWLTAQ